MPDVNIKIDCGRVTGGVISGFDEDTSYIVGVSGVGDFADIVDITGLVNPMPSANYSTYRWLTTNTPRYAFDHADIVANKNYLLRCHFNEGNESHIIGDSVMEVKINTVITNTIRQPDFLNSPYFDVRERAGAFHKGFILEFIAQADGAGIVDVEITVGLNNTGGDVRIAGIELLEAPPVADFSISGSGDQTNDRTFTDTSTGTPTSWAWDFGDGTVSTAQNPVHSFDAGTYTVSLVATNAYGVSETVLEDISVASLAALTLLPTVLTPTISGTAYAQVLTPSGGTTPYTLSLVPIDSVDYTDLGGDQSEAVRYGPMPNGLSVVPSGIGGTSSIPDPSLIVLKGDSLTNGHITGAAPYNADWSPSSRLVAMLPRSWKAANRSTSGETLVQIAAGYAAQVAPYYDAEYSKCIAFFDGGTNDVNLGLSTLAQMKTAMQGMVDAAKNDDFLVIAGNVTPYWLWAGATLTQAIDYNDWFEDILADVDYKINWASDERLANSHHNTYFHDGGIHHTALGYIARAEMIYTAINALSPNGTGNKDVTYKFVIKATDSVGNALQQEYELSFIHANGVFWTASISVVPRPAISGTSSFTIPANVAGTPIADGDILVARRYLTGHGSAGTTDLLTFPVSSYVMPNPISDLYIDFELAIYDGSIIRLFNGTHIDT